MLDLGLRLAIITIYISSFTPMISACNRFVYGVTNQDKCNEWWEEASTPGSTTTALCVDMIRKICPQMLDIRISSRSKWPTASYVSVVTEYLANHISTGRTISFDAKTSQELCWEVDKDCALLWKTFVSEEVSQNKKDKCRRLYDRYCGPSRMEEPVKPPLGAQSEASWEPMSYRNSNFGRIVSTSTKEYQDSNVNTEFTQKREKFSGTDSMYAKPESNSYDQITFKHEHSTREYRETSNTYHKQNSFTLDTSPGSPAAKTGLHPVLASLGGTETTVTEIEEREHKTTTESSLTKINGRGGLGDEMDTRRGLGRDSGSRKELMTETDPRMGLSNGQTREADPRVGLPSRQDKEADPRVGLPNRQATEKDPRVGLPNRSARERFEEKGSSNGFEPVKSSGRQDKFDPPKSLSVVINDPTSGTGYKHDQSSYDKSEFDRQENKRNEWVPSPYSRQEEYPVRRSNNGADYGIPSRSIKSPNEEQCDKWWQEAIQEYQSGRNPVRQIDDISANCPSLLEISTQPVKTVMNTEVNVEILKTVRNKVNQQTIRVALNRKEALCSPADIDCIVYWRIIYHVAIPMNIKQVCIDLVYKHCTKDKHVNSDGRLIATSKPPQEFLDELKSGRSK